MRTCIFEMIRMALGPVRLIRICSKLLVSPLNVQVALAMLKLM